MTQASVFVDKHVMVGSGSDVLSGVKIHDGVGILILHLYIKYIGAKAYVNEGLSRTLGWNIHYALPQCDVFFMLC